MATQSVTSANTPAQVAAYAANTGIDVIEFAAGTYHNWRACDLPDRTGHPLTLRPAAGARVVFDAAGDGSYGDRAFGLLVSGGGFITFDGSYGGGRFAFQHYLLAQTGLFLVYQTHDLVFRGMDFSNIGANANSNGQSSHLFYVARDCYNISISDVSARLMRRADEPLATGGANGIQLYTGGAGAAIHDVTISDVTVQDAGWALVARNATSGLTVNRLHAVDCGYESVPAAVDFGTDCTGTVLNSSAQSSVATASILGAMTDGGNNNWHLPLASMRRRQLRGLWR